MGKEFRILDQIIENDQYENNESNNENENINNKIEIIDIEDSENSIENYNLDDSNNNNIQILEKKLLEAISKDNKNSQDVDFLESQFKERKIIHRSKNKEFKKEFYEYLRKQSKYIF